MNENGLSSVSILAVFPPPNPGFYDPKKGDLLQIRVLTLEIPQWNTNTDRHNVLAQ